MENIATTQSDNYSNILQTYGVGYFPFEHYWQVREIKKAQGWIIHLSVVLSQIPDFLQLVIPELLADRVSFRIVRDSRLAFCMLEGSLGYSKLGKIVSIFPEDDIIALQVAKKLITLTSSFRGPAIPTDRHLGGVVYTRYGSFNPVLQTNADGDVLRFIYGADGRLIQDSYTVPFLPPRGIFWPFGEITSPEEPPKRKLLNNVYYPLTTLKADAKGDVIKALYFKKFWKIKSCLIKQGRVNMFTDAAGRDIKDRLKWQYELYQALHYDVPMPEVFDYFEENNDAYLAMEFIKGITLTTWLNAVYQNRRWLELPVDLRLILLDRLIDISEIIIRFHEKGFIHRDITPDNFLINVKGKIYLIDMELAWSVVTLHPDPPFLMGSPGHMSPEQMMLKKPTNKDDVYAFGGLMVIFFTNLFAMKFHGQSYDQLIRSYIFLIGDDIVAEKIAACWRHNPANRPELKDIQNVLKQYRGTVQQEEKEQVISKLPAVSLSEKEIKKIIQDGLAGLSHVDLLGPEKCWTSLSRQNGSLISNEQLDTSIYEPWHTGMAGPIWLVARAKRAGFLVDANQSTYANSWRYLHENHFCHPERALSGLFFGRAGIALAIIEGLKAGMLTPDPENISRLQQCFIEISNTFDLATGVAGQGIALLQSAFWLDKAWVQKTLSRHIEILLNNQQKDGSWNLTGVPNKKDGISTGLDNGVAGISWFLLCYLQAHPDNLSVKNALTKSLHWFEGNSIKKKNTYAWPLNTRDRSIDRWSMTNGTPGIALLFIKSYEVLGALRYRTIAEKILSGIEPYPVRMDFSMTTGLAGLGEVYIDAFHVLKDSQWLDRAAWIAQLIAHCFKRKEDGTGYWQTNVNIILTADLFTGNSGILHFLMRYLSPEIDHPLASPK